MGVFEFPIWLYVNESARAKDGYPYYVLIKGGSPPSLPRTLGVYGTEESAKKVDPGPPFKAVPVDLESFCEILKARHEIEEVVLELGTKEAVSYLAKDLLKRFCPSTQS